MGAEMLECRSISHPPTPATQNCAVREEASPFLRPDSPPAANNHTFPISRFRRTNPESK